MNWFKFIAALINIGSAAADVFVKNADSKKTKDSLVHVISSVVEGLANQNPDGTPAGTAYDGAAATVTPKQ
jgi:hypothetical protein